MLKFELEHLNSSAQRSAECTQYEQHHSPWRTEELKHHVYKLEMCITVKLLQAEQKSAQDLPILTD